MGKKGKEKAGKEKTGKEKKDKEKRAKEGAAKERKGKEKKGKESKAKEVKRKETASPLVSCTGCLLVKCSAFVPPSLVNHGMWLWTCSSTVILRRQRSNLRKLKLQLKLPRLLPRSVLHPPVMGMHQCSQLQCLS